MVYLVEASEKTTNDEKFIRSNTIYNLALFGFGSCTAKKGFKAIANNISSFYGFSGLHNGSFAG